MSTFTLLVILISLVAHYIAFESFNPLCIPKFLFISVKYLWNNALK